MTTSAYLALVEPVLTVAELVASDLRTSLKIGREFVTYTPRVDQPLSLEHTIEAFAEKHPANDNEPQEEAAPANPQPAFALNTNAALFEFMQKLRNAPGAPRLASEMANDWLKTASQPGAEFRGRQIVKQMTLIWPQIFKLISRQAAAVLHAGSERAKLKSMYNDVPAPKSVQLITRPAKEKWDAEHPRPQHKNDFAA